MIISGAKEASNQVQYMNQHGSAHPRPIIDEV